MLIALACLQEGLITPTTTLFCGGSYNYGNKSMACHGAHGSVQLARAIQASCNVYFAQCGMKLGSNRMKTYATMFGFGEKPGMDIPSSQEARGNVPDSAYMDKVFGRRGWSPYAPANWGIGQGEVAATPLQMARYTAAIANGGIVYQPHAVRAMYNKVLRQRNDIPYGATELPIDKKHIEAVQKGMYMVVNEPGGTAFSLKIPDIAMCGKTGTAQNKGRDHSWFVCYAPADDPKIAVCVMVENAGFGSTVAAPIAKQMVELYLKGRWPEELKPKTKIDAIDSTAVDSNRVDTTNKKKQEQPKPRGPFILSAAAQR
jgi:penicillin-binding protein 2